MKVNKIVLGLLAAGMSAGFLSSAYADDAARIKALEDQLQVLQKAIAELKSTMSTKQEVSELNDQVVLQGKEAVVLGDMPNSFRMPGSETSVRVYGYAEANMIKDFKGTAPGDTFTNLAEQPLNSANPETGKTVLTAQTSRFGFETSTPTALGPFHTVVEADFYAYCGSECNRNRLRLRHAYGEYAGWLVGQTWSTFMDLDDIPETADFNGPVGTPFSRVPMVRYTWNTPTGFSFKGALENGSDGAKRPNLVLVAGKSFDDGAVNLRFISHEQRSGALSTNGSGYGLGGSYKLTGDLTLMGQWAKVDGDADNALMIGANYPTVDPVSGSLLLDKSVGYALGVTNVFNAKWRASLVYGHVESQWNVSDPYALAAGPLGNKKLDQLHLNFFYTPIKNVDLGAEYIQGKRTTYSGEVGDLSRLNLMGRYSFN